MVAALQLAWTLSEMLGHRVCPSSAERRKQLTTKNSGGPVDSVAVSDICRPGAISVGNMSVGWSPLGNAQPDALGVLLSQARKSRAVLLPRPSFQLTGLNSSDTRIPAVLISHDEYV